MPYFRVTGSKGYGTAHGAKTPVKDVEGVFRRECADPRRQDHRRILQFSVPNADPFRPWASTATGNETCASRSLLLAYQPYGQEGLLIADLDLTAATGLLASRFRTIQ